MGALCVTEMPKVNGRSFYLLHDIFRCIHLFYLVPLYVPFA